MIPPHRTFPWGPCVLAYLDEPYNTTIENERAVEVPIARAWLAGEVGPVLEVGNVLGHYPGARDRTVVDLHERAPGVVNIDVLELRGSWPTIVSVSTVEHIGWPDQPGRAARAVQHMRGLLEPGGRMLLTVGFGQHPSLDAAILRRAVPGVLREWSMVRDDAGDWVEHAGPVFGAYGARDRWASSVWIGELEATS